MVANKQGEVGAMKILEDADGVAANTEGEYWNTIYEKKWKVWSKKWMGFHSVIMPRLDQFKTHGERLENLEAVRKCLQKFHQKGFIHEDVYWRNIGYYKDHETVMIVMLDLNPERGKISFSYLT